MAAIHSFGRTARDGDFQLPDRFRIPDTNLVLRAMVRENPSRPR